MMQKRRRTVSISSRRKQKPSYTRSDKGVNEEYYARDDTPSFNQFKTYHFYDQTGRFYKIAEQNGQTFQNERFANTNPLTGKLPYQTSPLVKRREKKCIVDGNGYIKLFVRLPSSKKVDLWFSTSSIDKSINVRERVTGEIQVLKIRSVHKVNQKRLTGTVYVSGDLNKSYCNRLLNT
jgi:hypothetical protein